jgi:putative oxidoreductase
MMIPQLLSYSDVALLLLRFMVGVVFLASGWNHLKDPAGRSKDIGMSKGFTIFLGAAEIAGSLGVIFGVLIQLAAIGLILVMLGAIQKKIMAWHRLLGQERFRLALRSAVRGHEPCHCDHGRWPVRPAEMKLRRRFRQARSRGFSTALRSGLRKPRPFPSLPGHK